MVTLMKQRVICLGVKAPNLILRNDSIITVKCEMNEGLTELREALLPFVYNQLGLERENCTTLHVAETIRQFIDRDFKVIYLPGPLIVRSDRI
jgi:hypothetical protein